MTGGGAESASLMEGNGVKMGGNRSEKEEFTPPDGGWRVSQEKYALLTTV